MHYSALLLSLPDHFTLTQEKEKSTSSLIELLGMTCSIQNYHTTINGKGEKKKMMYGENVDWSKQILRTSFTYQFMYV